MTSISSERRHISEFLPKKYLEKPVDNFSVAALVREMTSRGGRGKGKTTRYRGRPRKGMQKRVNEKKLMLDLKKELALREERVKEFGFIEAENEVEDPEDADNSGGEMMDSISVGRTRSGRLSRPPKQLLRDMEIKGDPEILAPEIPALPQMATTGAVTNMNAVTPPLVDSTLTSFNRRSFAPPAKYVCKVCGKIYLGDKERRALLVGKTFQ